MSRHDHRQFEQALASMDRAILPNVSRLLDGVIESAALARPGVDAAAYAASLRETAEKLARLAALVSAFAPGPQAPPRISA